MKAIIVDDEDFSLEYLSSLCEDISELEIMGKYQNIYHALDYLKLNKIQIVFMDIEMPGMNGIEAIRKIHEIQPDLGVIFVTGYEEYAMDAFREDAVSYLLKPCDANEVKKAINKAKCLVKEVKNRVVVQTFGRFCIFIDGKPYRFTSGKAKELLAVCIDRRGGVVSMEQAIDLLWEDRPYDNMVKQLYRKAVIYLNHLSCDMNLDFFVSGRGSCYVIPSKIDCDYFRLMEGDPITEKLYCGEYMMDYSWAEETIGKIDHFLY